MRFLVDPSQVTMSPIGWLFLLAICVLLPLGVVRQHRLAADMSQITRVRIYASAMATHAAFLLMSWAVAREHGLDLLLAYRLSALHVAIGVFALGVGLLPILERFRVDDPVIRQRTRLIAPRTPKEFAFFYLVSISAGVAEEITYRGVLFTLLAALLRNWWISALLAAAVFGIVHLFQGSKGAGIAGLMGLREHIVVGLTGTLWVAIVVHALHDAIAGTVIGLRARREEAQPPTITQTA